MKLRTLFKSLLCLSFAAVSAAAWNLHVLGAHHNADADCQVCAVAAAPELNADCGAALLAAPRNFSLFTPEAQPLTVDAVAIPAFYGRAPPAV
ncbi:MAG: hypothetical protein NTY45_06015 [Elusimicrobia bacterium]|nr:hypothetical protein [Elusimicrobiota bacterium]